MCKIVRTGIVLGNAAAAAAAVVVVYSGPNAVLDFYTSLHCIKT